MTKAEVQALGWAYGRLERALGYDYDKAGVRYNQACMRPIAGLAQVHAAAMAAGRITDRLARELAAALGDVQISEDSREPVQPLEMQGVWQIADTKGRAGQAWGDVLG